MSSNLNHYVDVDDIINVDNIELNSIHSPPPPLLKTLTAQNERFRLIK